MLLALVHPVEKVVLPACSFRNATNLLILAHAKAMHPMEFFGAYMWMALPLGAGA